MDEKQCILTTFDVCADVLREVEALVRAVVGSLSHTHQLHWSQLFARQWSDECAQIVGDICRDLTTVKDG